MNKVADIQSEIHQLYQKRQRQDITVDRFQRLLGDLIVKLFRAHASQSLRDDESILSEHHVVLGHFKLTQSVFKESDQESISLFATEKRLIRTRLLQKADAPIFQNSRDHTLVDELPYREIKRLTRQYDIRRGELIVGCTVVALSVLFRDLLQFTSGVLVVMGVLGILHSVLLPMRWIDIETKNTSRLEDLFRIQVVRKKSARKLIRLLKSKVG